MKGPLVKQVVIEAEMPDDSQTRFRLRVDVDVIAKNLTAVQAHFLFGEIVDRIDSFRSCAGGLSR
jgi:hypothetical protein